MAFIFPSLFSKGNGLSFDERAEHKFSILEGKCAHQTADYPVVRCSASISRRKFAQLSLVSLLGVIPKSANAGLLLFPLQKSLSNRYFLMRACETISNSKNIVRSNPVNQLSLAIHSLTPKGVNQALKASTALANAGLTSNALLWPAICMAASETAEVLANRLRIRRENVVPEYSFLDARGIGAFDGSKEDLVRSMLREIDEVDTTARPLPGEDGTPNDSVEDVFVRVRQLLAKLETQYFGENIVVISPDSDVLTILQASLLGQDLHKHHEQYYLPGEVRVLRELVVDANGKVVQQPKAEIVSKPSYQARHDYETVPNFMH